MLVIFYVDVIFVKFSIYHTQLSHLWWRNENFEMKIYKLVTRYPNMANIMWNDIVQYTFNFHKD